MEHRSPERRIIFVTVAIVLIIINLLVGIIGGVTGFVLLTNSKSVAIQNLRQRLGISADGSTTTIPVKQTFQLEESSALIDAVKKVGPAVVSISANQQVVNYFNGTTSSQEVGSGSGFILTSDGLIVTNKHVIAQTAQYKVVLSDGRIFDATVQTVDPYNDLAVLKITAKDLPVVDFGSSDDLQIGQSVFTVGNPLGEFRNTVTSGIVSGTKRSIEARDSAGGSERLTGLLQTDAPINPGNSGGPLVNLAGQVVGINTAIASTSGGSDGLGFAIPIDSIRVALASASKTGKIERPVLGVRYIAVTKTLQQINNLSVDYGALITGNTAAGQLAIIPGYPADKAGLRENDIILEINGERITEDTPLTKRLERYTIGTQITVKYLRGGNEATTTVTLSQAADSSATAN